MKSLVIASVLLLSSASFAGRPCPTLATNTVLAVAKLAFPNARNFQSQSATGVMNADHVDAGFVVRVGRGTTSYHVTANVAEDGNCYVDTVQWLSAN